MTIHSTTALGEWRSEEFDVFIVYFILFPSYQCYWVEKCFDESVQYDTAYNTNGKNQKIQKKENWLRLFWNKNEQSTIDYQAWKEWFVDEK